MAATHHDNVSHNGYANEATYFTSLIVGNEYKLYTRVRVISREHAGDPATAAPAVKRAVTDALAGRNQLLTPAQRASWREDFRHHDLTLANVDWVEIAETMGDDRRRRHTAHGNTRATIRAARRRAR